MSPDAQRITIAEERGWRTSECTVCGAPGHVAYSPNGAVFYAEASCLRSAALVRVIPDYLNDLNAIHEAEPTILTSRLMLAEWERHIRAITLRDAAEGSGLYERIIRATAAQRCEAFLRTIGQWDDSK